MERRKKKMRNKVTLLILLVAMVMAMTVGITSAYAQVPDHCGYSEEHACAVPNDEQAQQILEVFPDAYVIVDEELYESIPEEDREDAEGIIASGPRGGEDEDDEESSDEDSGKNVGDTLENAVGSSGGDILPGDTDNFQPIPPENGNLPSAQQSGAGLKDACLQSGFTEAQCNNYLFTDDPGQYCTTLKLAGLPCPKIQDPRFSYGNPEEAREQSEQQTRQTEEAIRGFENTVPNNLGEGFAMK
jgi:hypothetical protein